MVTRELLDFLRVQRSAGVSRQRLTQVLLAEGGWSKADLDEAFNQLEGTTSVSVSPVAPPESQGPISTAPRTLAERVATMGVVPTQSASASRPAVSQGQGPATGKGSPLIPAVIALEKHEDFLGIFSSSSAPKSVSASMFGPQRTPITIPEARKVTNETHPVQDSQVGPSAPLSPAFRPNTPTPDPLPKSALPAASSVPRQPFTLHLAPGEDFLGIFTAYERPLPAPRAPESPRPTPVPPRSVTPAPTRPPISVPPLRPKAALSIISELARPQKIAPLHQVPAINVASLSASRPIMSAPPSKGFIPSASKTITPSKPLPPRPVVPAVPVPPPASGIAPSVAATMTTDAERAVAVTGPRRISTIAPPKRTLQDLFLRVQGQVAPSPEASGARVVPQSSGVFPGEQSKSLNTVTPVPVVVLAAPASTVEKGTSEQADAGMAHSTDPGFPATTGSFSREWIRALLLIGIALMGIAIVAFAYVTFMTDDTPDVSRALTDLRNTPAFSYGVRGTVDFVIGENESTAEVAFEMVATGTVMQTAQGIGDGSHTGVFSGRIRDADMETRAISLEGDVRVLSDTAYLFTRSSPAQERIDPELLRTYWIAVPLADIARELSLSASVGSSQVNTFTGARDTRSIFALLAENMPLVPGGEARRTTIDGVETTVIDIVLSPEATLEFLRTALFERFGREVFLSEEEATFTRVALEKARGELAVDGDGFPRRFVFSFAPNDRLFGQRVVGTIDIEVVFAPLEGISVARPEMSLTVPELETEIRRFQEYKEMTARDAERVRALEAAQGALEIYREAKKRYPTQLTELSLATTSALSTVASSTLSELVYHGYLRVDAFGRLDRCAFRSAKCPAYHLGVSLEDPDNPYLDIDADMTGDILGEDIAGCSGEEGRVCLDRTQADLPTAIESLKPSE